MPTPIISSQWPRFVLPIIRRTWYQALAAVPSPLESLYNVADSNQSVEYSQGVGDFGIVPEYNSDTANGQPAAIPAASFNPLYESTFTHKEWSDFVAIERKLYEDDRSGLILRRASSLGNSFGSTIATHQSSILNNAFSSSYLGGDGVCLCSASHPYSKANSSVWSNAGSSALSYAAIVATQNLGFAMQTDKGLPFPIIYDTLVVPGALQATALEVTKGAFVPGQADLTASALYYQGQGLKILVDPYQTDANNWFMISSIQAKLHMLWFYHNRPEIEMDPSSNFMLVARYRGYMRYIWGWDDARFVYGHNV